MYYLNVHLRFTNNTNVKVDQWDGVYKCLLLPSPVKVHLCV